MMPENLQVAGKTVAQADLSFLKAGIAQRLRVERFEDALVESLQIACPKADGESRREPLFGRQRRPVASGAPVPSGGAPSVVLGLRRWNNRRDGLRAKFDGGSNVGGRVDPEVGGHLGDGLAG